MTRTTLMSRSGHLRSWPTRSGVSWVSNTGRVGCHGQNQRHLSASSTCRAGDHASPARWGSGQSHPTCTLHVFGSSPNPAGLVRYAWAAGCKVSWLVPCADNMLVAQFPVATSHRSKPQRSATPVHRRLSLTGARAAPRVTGLSMLERTGPATSSTSTTLMAIGKLRSSLPDTLCSSLKWPNS